MTKPLYGWDLHMTRNYPDDYAAYCDARGRELAVGEATDTERQRSIPAQFAGTQDGKPVVFRGVTLRIIAECRAHINEQPKTKGKYPPCEGMVFPPKR